MTVSFRRYPPANGNEVQCAGRSFYGISIGSGRPFEGNDHRWYPGVSCRTGNGTEITDIGNPGPSMSKVRPPFRTHRSAHCAATRTGRRRRQSRLVVFAGNAVQLFVRHPRHHHIRFPGQTRSSSAMVSELPRSRWISSRSISLPARMVSIARTPKTASLMLVRCCVMLFA